MNNLLIKLDRVASRLPPQMGHDLRVFKASLEYPPEKMLEQIRTVQSEIDDYMQSDPKKPNSFPLADESDLRRLQSRALLPLVVNILKYVPIQKSEKNFLEKVMRPRWTKDVSWGRGGGKEYHEKLVQKMLDMLTVFYKLQERYRKEYANLADKNVTLKAGHFTVHNTGFSDDEVNTVIACLDKASGFLSHHGFGKALYGDVYIVGNIHDADTAAWYRVAQDDIYFRAGVKFGQDTVDTLCHELGHRWWYKHLPNAVSNHFQQLYDQLKGGTNIEKGMRIPFRGEEYEVVALNYGGSPSAVTIRVYENGVYKEDSWVEKKVLKNMLNQLKYPTAYSAQDVSEFFAELFMLYVTGKARDTFKTMFESGMAQA